LVNSSHHCNSCRFYYLVCHCLDAGISEKGYLLRERDISYKTGVFFYKEISVTFNRIQHVEVSQGIPTDYNLLWDSARKCIDAVCVFMGKYNNLQGLRKIKSWESEKKGLMREPGKATASGVQRQRTEGSQSCAELH
jgi:hypothetical protein